ncbi:Trm112 family protein [Aureimonas populi]|uniref:UPF0434 protein ACFSKQ_03145 n=1 Tax=Aureimonas populi TaxID=1701758 RepID=A0ABW5CGQ9_9HYPH|nr:Trm112 family protein [Aureimonas populi]
MSGNDRDPQAGDTARLRPDPRLLELLVCPLTKTPLSYDAQRNELVSAAARLAYPIRDGIPIMLASEARSLE